MAETRGVIATSAPAKVVLSGEYAVLIGAPALVAALDRRVRCRLTVRQQGGWDFRGTGHEMHQRMLRDEVLASPADTLAGIVPQVLRPTETPPHVAVEIDSTACYQGGVKLGIGSSAAVVASFATALSALAGRRCRLAELLALHQRLQGGGSGLDVAAAATGGVIRFETGKAVPVTLPRGLHLRFVFAGHGTATAPMLARFHAWRSGEMPAALRALKHAAGQVAAEASVGVAAAHFLESLALNAEALMHMDDAAGIGIFGPAHRTAARLAAKSGVVYKPCGAGGGDIGVAASDSVERLGAFLADTAEAGLTPIAASIDPDGVG
ncbi:MAG: hypothetical protein F4Y86_18155 [Gammaproteobacteria bacterium]|nr:hypothetical protein [Gammaproteobacteria bacterium]MYB38214.1 hypothetical protein [Gammaproteobacteria bacterium]